MKDTKTWIYIFTQSSQRCFGWVLFHLFTPGDQVSGSSPQSGRAQVQTWVSQSLTLVLCMIIYTGWKELINKMTKCNFKSSFTPNYSVMHTHNDRLTVTGCNCEYTVLAVNTMWILYLWQDPSNTERKFRGFWS